MCVCVCVCVFVYVCYDSKIYIRKNRFLSNTLLLLLLLIIIIGTLGKESCFSQGHCSAMKRKKPPLGFELPSQILFHPTIT